MIDCSATAPKRAQASLQLGRAVVAAAAAGVVIASVTVAVGMVVEMIVVIVGKVGAPFAMSCSGVEKVNGWECDSGHHGQGRKSLVDSRRGADGFVLGHRHLLGRAVPAACRRGDAARVCHPQASEDYSSFAWEAWLLVDPGRDDYLIGGRA
jgi:hypothetical protein